MAAEGPPRCSIRRPSHEAASGEWLIDSAQRLDLRQTYGVGLGRDIIRTESASFGVIGGTTLVREQLTAGVDHQNAEALAGAKLTFAVWSRNTSVTRSISTRISRDGTGWTPRRPGLV
jgi:uncharacterized protein DUF481